MCCASPQQLVALQSPIHPPGCWHTVLNILWSHKKVDFWLIVLVLSNYCFLVGNWTSTLEALSLTSAVFFVTEIHAFCCMVIPSTFRIYGNCPFGKSISTKHSSGLSRFCQHPARWSGEERENLSSGPFSFKDLMLCFQQPSEACIKLGSGWVCFWEQVFQTFSALCSSTCDP